jgi:formamidopyrimidine-DNA glycosylase
MPELPEIEALRETVQSALAGRRPTGITVRQFALVKTYDPPLDTLLGQPLAAVRRHGKHLLLDFEADLTLAVHLGIGGRLLLGEGRRPPRAVSLEMALDGAGPLRIVELGTKKRSSVHLIRAEDVPVHLGSLGVDALAADLTPDRLASLLSAQRVQLKHFLIDQRQIAGIGNAYSDEILWEAHLAPLRLSTTLEGEEIERLHSAIRQVLEQAAARAREDNYLMEARGDERGFFQVHRRGGEPCPRCGEAIASIHFAESSLQYCPACQVEGRRYADRRLSRLLR